MGSGTAYLSEEVAHARGSDTHEHLHEIRARDGEEWAAGLARSGLGQERLARAWWAHQECSLQ
eukprot:scaffold2119_cov355-Prasinococcus_capsulatus_cf.AAC.10